MTTNHTQRFLDEAKPGMRVWQVILRGKRRVSFGFWDKASFEDRLASERRKKFDDVVVQKGRVNEPGWETITLLSWDDFKRQTFESLHLERFEATQRVKETIQLWRFGDDFILETGKSTPAERQRIEDFDIRAELRGPMGNELVFVSNNPRARVVRSSSSTCGYALEILEVADDPHARRDQVD